MHFIRHAQAIEFSTGLPDEQRYLTCRGRKRFRQVAVCLKKMNIDPDFILSSPKVRAVQTAEILAETLRFNGEVRISPELTFGPGLVELDALLRANNGSSEVVIVGHEPALGEVVASLLQLSTPCYLSKGCVVSVKISQRQSVFSADLAGMITAGGKAIRKTSVILERLTGLRQTIKEEAR